jgi:hypothetical protein
MAVYFTIGAKMLTQSLRSHLIQNESMIHDMSIVLSDLVECQLISKKNTADTSPTDFVTKTLNVQQIIPILRKMECCKCMYSGYMSNGGNILKLIFANGSEQLISISSNGKYLGYTAPRSSYNYWYYLPNELIGELLLGCPTN